MLTIEPPPWRRSAGIAAPPLHETFAFIQRRDARLPPLRAR
jgi:hypothetical protein